MLGGVHLLLVLVLISIVRPLDALAGGNYKLFLKQYDDEQLLIWQGNNTADYEANLDLLESAGLPIE